MNEQLRRELDAVRRRYGRLIALGGLAAAWVALALVGVALLAWMRGQVGATVPIVAVVALVVLAAVGLPAVLRAMAEVRRPLWLARRVERRFPDLDARLLAAVEVRAGLSAAARAEALGFLEQSVVDETVDHARRARWPQQLVPPGQLRVIAWTHGIAAATFGVVLVALVAHVARRGPSGGLAVAPPPATRPGGYAIRVEPEDTSLERGTSLIVLARFEGSPPEDVRLVVRDAAGATRDVAMSRSLDDPMFAGRVPSVDADLTYAVRHGGQQTRWYKAGVFDFPALRQADAKLAYPTYTGEPVKVIEDVRRITAVEGTRATLSFHLNKPVAAATLVPKANEKVAAAEPKQPADAPPSTAPAAEPLKLVADATDPTLYTTTIDLRRSATYRLQLKDDADRGSKQPAELAVAVTPNRPPDLKIDFPGRDVDASPIEEMTVRAKVWDDFGVRRVGVSYALAGQPMQETVLAESIPGKSRREVTHTIALEKLAAQPDQLLSYFVWAEDHATDGSIRRTSSDLFFAEVRPFEEIFRQGQQPTAAEQERQERERQQQQQNGGGENAEKAEQLGEMQKQIIAATWKVVRRETGGTPTPVFVPDVKLIAESQASAKEKAAGIAEKLEDEKSKAHLQNVLKFMESAAAELAAAADGPATSRLSSALPIEQAAYQELLKLRAREHEVVKGQQRQQQGQQSASSASSRRQQQLDQLKLSDEQNRYEQQRSAQERQQQQQPENAQQRETRQVLSRLKELAQRQEDLNRQMKETQAALAAAKEQAKKEELQRQLARLRDQQREMLRDTDELRDRTDQPENQERMTDARQQLDQTRNDVRKASESLEQGKVPEAAVAGERASERLKNLRDEVRKAAAGQFSDAVSEMRQNARELDEKQKELSQRLSDMDGRAPRSQQPRDPQQQQREQRASAGQKPAAGGENAGQPRDGAGQPRDRANAGEPRDGAAQARNDAGSPPRGNDRGDARVSGQPAAPRRAASLRTNGDGREQIAEDLKQQKERLEKLLEQMRQTSESAEAAEPLLSKQLYDTVRKNSQQRTDEALDATRQLVDRGFVDEAKRAEGEAGKGVKQLREGVEQAARGVLGDETEALRRARAELDALAQAVDREMRRNQPNEPTTRPGGALAERAPADDNARAAGGATTRPANRQVADARGGRQQQPGDGPERNADPQAGERATASDRQGQAGNGQRPGGNRAGAPQDQGEQPGGRGERQTAANGQGRPPVDPTTRPASDERQASAEGQRRGQGQPEGQESGQERADGSGRGKQPGEQPNDGGAAGGGQGQRPGPQPDAERAGGNGQGQQPGEGQARGGGGGQPGQRPGDATGEQQASAAQPGGAGRPGGQRPQANGLRGGGGTGGERPEPNGQGANRERNGSEGGGGGAREFTGPEDGPITGESFRQWSDRLRDVEEMVGDPRLRAEAARIRDQAKAVRAEADRHSKRPNWDVVRQTIGQPLAELRAAVSEELRRRESPDALAPIDRDPVPAEYAEQVRRYYERLGSGK